MKKFYKSVDLAGTTDWANAAGATLLEYVHEGGDVIVDRIVGDLAAVASATAGEGGVLVIGVGLKRANSDDADVYSLLGSEANVVKMVLKGQLWYINRVALSPQEGVLNHDIEVLTARRIRVGDKIQVGVWWMAYDGVQSDNIMMSAHMMGFATQV